MLNKRQPGIFIPTLYFAEGLPYTIVALMSGVFFKSIGVDNVAIGWTSLLTLPFTLKFLWSPVVDYYGSKRGWIIACQAILAVLTIALAATIWVTAGNGLSFGCAVAVMAVLAIASATQDVSIDGYYLDVLNQEQKAFFVGVRNTAYRIAMIFGSGAMVVLAGNLAKTNGMGLGWAVAFGICGISLLVASAFHFMYLPQPQTKDSAPAANSAEVQKGPHFIEAISTYFKQPGIIAIVIYILTFRFGDALMLKQAPNFLLDPTAKGGLGIDVADIGMISGTVGVVALLLGGILASWLISKGGLRRWMWPLAATQSLAILLYFALAQWPNQLACHSFGATNCYLPAVYIVNSLEQFAYGMGVAVYTVFLLSTVGNKYKAAHYATATALMALGMVVPGTVSGYLYNVFGYANFFLVSFFASLPGIVTIFFLPMRESPAQASSEERETVGISQTGQVGSESQ